MRLVLRLGFWLVAIGAFSAACKQVQPQPEPTRQTKHTSAASLPVEPEAKAASDRPVVAAEPVLPSVPSSVASSVPYKPMPKIDARPEIRRLVVSSAIKDKEPVPFTVLKVNDPVVAFLELANPNPTELVVQVSFQHESGSEVGFVPLNIPASKKRWRTWAQTEMIRQVGKWTAIVRGADGTEIGQHGFFVSPS
jgi:Protein of unknown function (DUF2914)